MQNVFETNLRRFSAAADAQNTKADESQKYKIDIMDTPADDESEPNNDENLDDDEKEIKQSINRNKFESVFGIEGEESQVSSELRKSRAWFSKKSESKIRSSIAGKFF